MKFTFILAKNDHMKIFIIAAIGDSKVYMRDMTGVISMSFQSPICCIIMIVTIGRQGGRNP
jgi:hypothetical protein